MGISDVEAMDDNTLQREVFHSKYTGVQIEALLDKVSAYVLPSIVNHTDSSAVIAPNVLHVWGEVAELNIELAEPENSDVLNEYMIEFCSGETATVLTLPEEVKFVSPVNIEPDMRYQISIVNNIGVIAGV